MCFAVEGRRDASLCLIEDLRLIVLAFSCLTTLPQTFCYPRGATGGEGGGRGAWMVRDGACTGAAGGGGSWWCLLVRGAPLASYGLVAHFSSCSPVVLLLLLPMCLSSVSVSLAYGFKVAYVLRATATITNHLIIAPT